MGKSIDFFVLQLFSSYVDIPIEFLPEEAKDIHSECKGSPMVISMIGGLISESGRHSQRQRQSGRWGYYLNSLQSRKFSMFFFLSRKFSNIWIFAAKLAIPGVPTRFGRVFCQKSPTYWIREKFVKNCLHSEVLSIWRIFSQII